MWDPGALHGADSGNSFQDHDNSEDITKSFDAIYRSKWVTSISNDTDPEGRTKIVTMLKIQLPHR